MFIPSLNIIILIHSVTCLKSYLDVYNGVTHQIVHAKLIRDDSGEGAN